MTDAELAILSLLAEGSSYDYDLNKQIDARGLRRWTAIGHSSMYYVLEKLERQGLVEKLSDQHGLRLFGISPAGMGVLQTAVADLLSTPHGFDRGFELGLANLHVLRPSQVRSALLSRQQDVIGRISKLQAERSKAGGIFQIEALYDHSLALLRAELSWLEDFIPRWEAQAPAEPEQVIEPSIAPRFKQVIMPQDEDSVHKKSTRDANPNSRSTPSARDTMPPVNKKTDTSQS